MREASSGDWAIFQQWDAARRFLMLSHPKDALTETAILLGTWSFRLGWNRIVRDKHAADPEVYVYISETVGQTTTKRPPVPLETIHTITEPPPELHTSKPWITLRRLGRLVVLKELIPNAATEVARIENSIENFARDYRHIELMQSKAWGGKHRMQKAFAASKWNGVVDENELFKPIYELVDEYLNFQLPGMIASEVLSFLLASLGTSPPLEEGSPQYMLPIACCRAIEHLANIVCELLDTRSKMDLLSYYQMTYLANLYALTVLRLTRFAEPVGWKASNEFERFDKMVLNVDELYAHKIGPSYELPALFDPDQILAWLERNSSGNLTSRDQAEYWQIHPALRQLLDESQSTRADSIVERVKLASDKAENFSPSDAIKTTAAPIAHETVRETSAFATKMFLGRAWRTDDQIQQEILEQLRLGISIRDIDRG
jgi:hypothetical protein